MSPPDTKNLQIWTKYITKIVEVTLFRNYELMDEIKYFME